MSAIDSDVRTQMERNLRVLPWWWVLRWTWLGEAIWVIYLVDERGLTLGQVLLFQAVLSVISLVSQVPTGMLADRYGRRPTMLAASALWVVAFPMLGLNEEIPALLAALALFGVGEALMTGADDAFLFDALRALGRESEFAHRVGRLHAATTGVTAVLTIAGAAMVRWVPLSWPILASAGFSVAALAVGWRLVEPPRDDRGDTFLRTGWSATRRVLRHGSLGWTIAIMATVQTAGIVALITFQPIAVGFGAPVWSLGGFAAALMLAAAAGGWWSGAMARRLGFGRVLRTWGALGAVALFGGAGGVVWLFPLFMLALFAWDALQPPVADFLSRRVPDGERATVLSLSQLASQLMTIAVSLALATTIDRWGAGPSLAATAATMLLFVAFAYSMWRRADDSEGVTDSADIAGGPAATPDA